MDLSVLFDVSYGMYIIGVNDQGKLGGCIINTVMQITSENPIVAVSMNKDNFTYELIKNAGCFSISILSEKTSQKVIGTFGFRSGKDYDKYKDCSYELEHNMPVIKENCCGALFFDLISMTDMDTHVVLFGRLTDTMKLGDYVPMTYSYYHAVVKGKAPKNAPTYQKEEETSGVTKEKVSYVCKICGYVYEGDINEETQDYKCPICGKSKEYFEKRT